MKIFFSVKKIFSVFLILFFTQAFAQNYSDSEINANVHEKITNSAMLKHSDFHITVNTADRVVGLEGIVPSRSEAIALVELVQSVPGVKDVNTVHLIVKGSDMPLSDAYITAKVKGEFLKEKLFGDSKISAWTISVETKNNIVYLTGTAKNKQEVENAVRLARAVAGVKHVKYRVKTREHHANEITNE